MAGGEEQGVLCMCSCVCASVFLTINPHNDSEVNFFFFFFTLLVLPTVYLSTITRHSHLTVRRCNVAVSGVCVCVCDNAVEFLFAHVVTRNTQKQEIEIQLASIDSFCLGKQATVDINKLCSLFLFYYPA